MLHIVAIEIASNGLRIDGSSFMKILMILVYQSSCLARRNVVLLPCATESLSTPPAQTR